MWPVGQAVKTPPFHGGISGSNPLPVTIFFFGRLAQLGERLPYKQNVSGSIPLAPTNLKMSELDRPVACLFCYTLTVLQFFCKARKIVL